MTHQVRGRNTCTLMREIQQEGGMSVFRQRWHVFHFTKYVYSNVTMRGSSFKVPILPPVNLFLFFFRLQSFSWTGTQQQMGIYIPMPFFLTVPFATSVVDNKEQGMLLDEEITRNLIESYDGDIPFLSAINGVEILHCKMYR